MNVEFCPPTITLPRERIVAFSYCVEAGDGIPNGVWLGLICPAGNSWRSCEGIGILTRFGPGVDVPRWLVAGWDEGNVPVVGDEATGERLSCASMRRYCTSMMSVYGHVSICGTSTANHSP